MQACTGWGTWAIQRTLLACNCVAACALTCPLQTNDDGSVEERHVCEFDDDGSRGRHLSEAGQRRLHEAHHRRLEGSTISATASAVSAGTVVEIDGSGNPIFN